MKEVDSKYFPEVRIMTDRTTLDGYSWIATDYEEIDGQLYKVDYQYVIDRDKILSRIIKKVKVTGS